MQDLLLLAVVAAAFVFGWFLMKSLDRFLENHRRVRNPGLSSGTGSLRIGLSNPLLSDSLTDILEQYCRICPDSPVRIFYGAEAELIKGLLCRKLDIIFLSANMDVPADGRCGTRKVLLGYTPVIMKYGGLPIEPIAEGTAVQRVLWLKETPGSSANYFIGCIKDISAVSGPEK